MTEILDGPAAGKLLMIFRNPKYLRVVKSQAGQWDGLDQLSDTARAGETIFAYRLESSAGAIHIRSARRGGSGIYPRGRYRLVDPQPSDATMRSNGLWREWCWATNKAEIKSHQAGGKPDSVPIAAEG